VKNGFKTVNLEAICTPLKATSVLTKLKKHPCALSNLFFCEKELVKKKSDFLSWSDVLKNPISSPFLRKITLFTARPIVSQPATRNTWV
jgi:hypothetical protein